MLNDKIKQWSTEIRVLDGGFDTEIQKRKKFKINGHKNWFCKLLKDDPNLVCEIHRSFIRAGCDIISTNTYQASPQSLAELLNVTHKEAIELMYHSVRLVRRAITAEEENRNSDDSVKYYQRKLPILIAGLLGPYGACLPNDSEFTSSYIDQISFIDLTEFHYKRAKILVDAGVDLIAWNTISHSVEVLAICEVMKQLSNTPCWILIASIDGQTTVTGDSLRQIALELENNEQVFGIGINCNIPHNLIGQALANLNSIYETCESGNEEGFHPPPCTIRKNHSEVNEKYVRKIFILCPGNGHVWMPSAGQSSKPSSSSTSGSGHYILSSGNDFGHWVENVSKWAKRRLLQTNGLQQNKCENILPLAQWVGGCCHVGPEEINRLARWMKPDEFLPSNLAMTLSSIKTNTVQKTSDKTRKVMGVFKNKSRIVKRGNHYHRKNKRKNIIKEN